MKDRLNSIHHGDCIAGMKALPKGCVDLAFADPPFNIGYEYDVYDDRKERQHYLDWSKQWISAVHRSLKPTGAFWLAIGDEYAAELKLLSQDVGFHCRSWVIWYYTFGVNCSKKFTRSHAHLFHFVKDSNEFTFRDQELENRVPSARQLVYADARANSFGRLPDDSWILRPQDCVDSFTASEDTWYFPRVAGTFKERAGFHGCQMPEQLLGRIIRTCSHEDELVLDPFSGSATTLAVAKKLGRRFVGFDLSEDYVRLGRERLEGIRRGDPLNGASEPNMSAPPTIGRNIKKAIESNLPSTSPRREDLALDKTLRQGVIRAFTCIHNGFSVDRIVADPDLNSRFAEECQRLGLFGDVRTWNRVLFRLRKSGALADIPTTCRTTFSWLECSKYLFASEIAWQRMLVRGAKSLDEILCDPQLAKEFDQEAQLFAPGHQAIEYRWAALKLRKEANDAFKRSGLLKAPAKPECRIPLSEVRRSKIDEGPGLYFVSDAGSKNVLYIGETLGLRSQLEYQFSAKHLKAWRHAEQQNRELGLGVLPLPARFPELLAYQSLLIQHYSPALNYKHDPSNEDNVAA